MKSNLRLFKIFLILIAIMVGNFTFAQQKALTEKEKLAKELQVVKASDLQDVVPGVVSKFNYNKPVTSKVDFSKQGNRGLLFDNGPFVTTRAVVSAVLTSVFLKHRIRVMVLILILLPDIAWQMISLFQKTGQ